MVGTSLYENVRSCISTCALLVSSLDILFTLLSVANCIIEFRPVPATSGAIQLAAYPQLSNRWNMHFHPGLLPGLVRKRVPFQPQCYQVRPVHGQELC